jgi:hypothetical protein
MTALAAPELRVWRVTDERPGHLAQTEGLCEALSKVTRTQVVKTATFSAMAAVALLLGRSPHPARRAEHAAAMAMEREPPDLILCCGHSTHLAGLALRRIVGGRLVVLMRPSLPVSWFDLVVAPRHDGLLDSGRVISTQGVLNPLTAFGSHQPKRGLILLGGPSRHHTWDEDSLLPQVHVVAASDQAISWTLTTSRRTPPSTVQKLAALTLPNLAVTPLESTGPGWIATALADVAQAWVTEDSVSMVYESLTAGVAVGLIEVPAKGSSRVARGVAQLAEEGRVTRFSNWQPGTPLTLRPPLAEADRVAGEILRRWFPERLGAGGKTME